MKLFKDGKIYNSKEVQAILGVSERTIRRRIKSGEMIAISVKGENIKIAGYRLNQYIARREKSALEKKKRR